MFTNDKLWLTDITEHSTAEGVLYLCAIKGACHSVQCRGQHGTSPAGEVQAQVKHGQRVDKRGTIEVGWRKARATKKLVKNLS